MSRTMLRGSCGVFIAATASAAGIAPVTAETQARPNIDIQSIEEFDAEHGVRSGSGTPRIPTFYPDGR